MVTFSTCIATFYFLYLPETGSPADFSDQNRSHQRSSCLSRDALDTICQLAQTTDVASLTIVSIKP